MEVEADVKECSIIFSTRPSWFQYLYIATGRAKDWGGGAGTDSQD